MSNDKQAPALPLYQRQYGADGSHVVFDAAGSEVIFLQPRQRRLNMKNQILRQGDVLLVPISQLPEGCTEVPPENDRIVLMHGELTGHAHAIANWKGDAKSAKAAADAIGLAGRRARLLRAPDGRRFLEVGKPVNLVHEEHTEHQIAPGFYELPVQVEWSLDKQPRRVTD